MRIVSGILALSILAGALVGCGGPKEEVAPATPQDLPAGGGGTGSSTLNAPAGADSK